MCGSICWKISADDERHLDLYEGYPSLYGKETVEVKGRDGTLLPVMAYTMTERFRGNPARPPPAICMGFLRAVRSMALKWTPYWMR